MKLTQLNDLLRSITGDEVFFAETSGSKYALRKVFDPKRTGKGIVQWEPNPSSGGIDDWTLEDIKKFIHARA